MTTIDPAAVASTTIGDKPYRLLIGGTWHEASAGATFPVINPATDAILASVADAGAVETRAAIDAAAAALPAWAATPARSAPRFCAGSPA
ncbi:MAG TPA: aldehyde dehydrogenase family protein [Roseiflexaceae bacterium]